MYNGHADVTLLANALGKTVATYYYDAFGEIIDSSGSADNPIRYAGYQYDEETGLYYLNARMYDPTIARFLQEDTYTGNQNDPLSLNLYAYCNNNPLIYADPTGHLGTTTGNGVPYEVLHPGKSSTSSSPYNNGVPKDILDKMNQGSTSTGKSASTSASDTENNGVPKDIMNKANKASSGAKGITIANYGVAKEIQDKLNKNIKSLDQATKKPLEMGNKGWSPWGPLEISRPGNLNEIDSSVSNTQGTSNNNKDTILGDLAGKGIRSTLEGTAEAEIGKKNSKNS